MDSQEFSRTAHENVVRLNLAKPASCINANLVRSIVAGYATPPNTKRCPLASLEVVGRLRSAYAGEYVLLCLARCGQSSWLLRPCRSLHVANLSVFAGDAARRRKTVRIVGVLLKVADGTRGRTRTKSHPQQLRSCLVESFDRSR